MFWTIVLLLRDVPFVQFLQGAGWESWGSRFRHVHVHAPCVLSPGRAPAGCDTSWSRPLYRHVSLRSNQLGTVAQVCWCQLGQLGSDWPSALLELGNDQDHSTTPLIEPACVSSSRLYQGWGFQSLRRSSNMSLLASLRSFWVVPNDRAAALASFSSVEASSVIPELASWPGAIQSCIKILHWQPALAKAHLAQVGIRHLLQQKIASAPHTGHSWASKVGATGAGDFLGTLLPLDALGLMGSSLTSLLVDAGLAGLSALSPERPAVISAYLGEAGNLGSYKLT